MNAIVSDLSGASVRKTFVKNNQYESLGDFVENILQSLSCTTDYEDMSQPISFSDMSIDVDGIDVVGIGELSGILGNSFDFDGYSISDNDKEDLDEYARTLDIGDTLDISFSVGWTSVDESDIISTGGTYNVTEFMLYCTPLSFYSEAEPLEVPQNGTTFTPSFILVMLSDLKEYTSINVTNDPELRISSLTLDYQTMVNNYDGAGLVTKENGIEFSFFIDDATGRIDENGNVQVTLSNTYFVWAEALNPVYIVSTLFENLLSIEANHDHSINRGENYHADIYFQSRNGWKLDFYVKVRGVDVTSSVSNYDADGENEHITVDIQNVNGNIIISGELYPDNNYVRWYNHNKKTTTYYNYQIKDGWTYQDNFNEELDNATIIIRTGKTDFQPMDMIEIKSLYLNKTMIITSVIENKCNFIPKENGREMYDYVITLGSLTKMLERITLPSFSYTKPFGKTRKKISDVIDIILEDYSPKIIVNGVKQNLYSFDSNYNFVYSTDCPDMVFENMTLREAINQLLSVVNSTCILTINEFYNLFVIEDMWLNDSVGEISKDVLKHFNYPQENQSIEDYASETENEYHNIVPKSAEDFTLVTEYLHFVNEDNVQITTDNMYLQTNYPIYDIKEMKLVQFRENSSNQNECYYKNFYLGIQGIEQAYDNINILDPTTWDFLPMAVLETQECQLITETQRATVVRYSRGDNKIIGWGDQFNLNLPIVGNVGRQTWWYISLLSRDLASRNLGNENFFDTFAASVFRIQYYTLTEKVRAKSGKLLPEPHDSTLVNNQNEGFVDMQLQGTNFQDKVNRLGNRAKVLQGRFNIKDARYIPQLASSTENMVVIGRELTFYNNFIAVKLILTENYVNINYFTGINARKRSWNLVSINETINKQILDKWYCEFDFTRGTRTTEMSQWNEQAKFMNQGLLSCFDTSYDLYPAFAVIRTTDTYHTNVRFPWLELELNKYASGRSIIFHFKTLDNFSVGKFLKQYDDQGSYTNYSEGASAFQEFANYTDNNGELTNNRYQIAILDRNFIAPGLAVPADGQIYDDAYTLGLLDYAREKPLIDLDGMGQSNIDRYSVYVTEIDNHKDSKECIEFNLQFEYCSATSDIIVTPLLAQRCKMVHASVLPDLHYHIDKRNYYLNDKCYYAETGRDLSSDDVNIVVANEGKSSNNQVTITIYDTIQSDEKSLIITQTTSYGEEIVMVINNINDHLRNSRYIDFYMNMYRGNRDHKNYTTADMKNWTI